MTTEALVLIDTSVWISALRPRAAKKTKELVERILDEDRSATCGIITAELLSGTRSKKEYHELFIGLQALHYLPTPESIWHRVSELGFKLRTKGIHVPTSDLLIAQIAMDNHCILLHCDAHFDLIARHSSLKGEAPPKRGSS